MSLKTLIHVAFLIVLLQTKLAILAKEQERGLFDYLFGACKCKCGIPNREARINGGEFIKNHEFPWLVQIHLISGVSLPGAIINNKYILTGASHIINLTAFDVKVTLGQYDRCNPDTSSSNVSVDKIVIHPEFGPSSLAHDIALVKLSSPIVFQAKISPICLPMPGHSYLGQVATVVGWKEDDYCRPKKAGLPVLGRHEQCMPAHESLQQHLTPDTSCLGVIGVDSIVCKEDAGGPVMYRSYKGVYELIGVLSTANSCKSLGSRAIYTNVNDHLGWITKNTKDACFCFKI